MAVISDSGSKRKFKPNWFNGSVAVFIFALIPFMLSLVVSFVNHISFYDSLRAVFLNFDLYVFFLVIFMFFFLRYKSFKPNYYIIVLSLFFILFFSSFYLNRTNIYQNNMNANVFSDNQVSIILNSNRFLGNVIPNSKSFFPVAKAYSFSVNFSSGENYVLINTENNNVSYTLGNFSDYANFGSFGFLNIANFTSLVNDSSVTFDNNVYFVRDNLFYVNPKPLSFVVHNRNLLYEFCDYFSGFFIMLSYLMLLFGFFYSSVISELKRNKKIFISDVLYAAIFAGVAVFLVNVVINVNVLTSLTAETVYFFLKPFYHSLTLSGISSEMPSLVFHSLNNNIGIYKNCSGIDSLAIYIVFFVFALLMNKKKISAQKKIGYFAIGLGAVFALNILRILIIVFLILYSNPAFTNLVHTNLGMIISVVFILFYFSRIFDLRVNKNIKIVGFVLLLIVFLPFIFKSSYGIISPATFCAQMGYISNPPDCCDHGTYSLSGNYMIDTCQDTACLLVCWNTGGPTVFKPVFFGNCGACYSVCVGSTISCGTGKGDSDCNTNDCSGDYYSSSSYPVTTSCSSCISGGHCNGYNDCVPEFSLPYLILTLVLLSVSLYGMFMRKSDFTV